MHEAGVPKTVDARDGEKGPLVVQAAWTAVQAEAEGKVSDAVESLVVFRELQGDGTWKHGYLLSDATSRRSDDRPEVCYREGG